MLGKGPLNVSNEAYSLITFITMSKFHAKKYEYQYNIKSAN
jgi:hypothetical protein